MHQELHKG